MGSELMQLLEREARVEKDRVLEEARRRAEEIRSAARREAEETLATARLRLEQARQQAKTRAQSAASLRAAALLLEAKDRAIRQVFERASAEIDRAVADPARRRALLRRLLEEAAQGLPTEGAALEVPPGDADAAREAARALGLALEVRESPEVRGGLRLTTRDRRIVVENTVASRLARTRSALVSRIAEILWGEAPGAR
jgi:V/A-type H+-transporting ATPase subunit E